MELVSTVTRWRRWLDYQLSQVCHTSLDKLEPLVAELLRAGICELAILGTPAYATVHSWVDVTRAMVRPQAARLVNGVLRRIADQLRSLPEPDTGDKVRDIAIRWSHPTWLARRYVKRFGTSEATLLMQSNNRAPRHYVRANTMKVSPGDFELQLSALNVYFTAIPHLDYYYQVSNLGPILGAGMLQNGICAVHDASAGLVVRLLDPQPNENILDACAAPGGKTCQIAQRMGDKGRITAWDRHPGRTDRIRRAVEANGFASITVKCQDLFAADTGSFDRVLVDVPCTGTGVLAKRADLRWHRTSDMLDELIVLQDRLLDSAAKHVKSGGRLVYSTCSIEPEENEERIGAFLSRNKEFRMMPATCILPKEFVTDAGNMATLPHRQQVDGAFAACLQRL